MAAETTVGDWLRGSVWPRARIVGGSFTVGGLASGLLVGGMIGTGTGLLESARFVFALGALCFGLGLLGWSGSVMAGRGFENMQAHLDVDTDWTERDSRRAMARVGGFGAGGMTATGVLEALALAA
jgi:hypothetical protein